MKHSIVALDASITLETSSRILTDECQPNVVACRASATSREQHIRRGPALIAAAGQAHEAHEGADIGRQCSRKIEADKPACRSVVLQRGAELCGGSA